jgi:hypothetical protein
MVKNTFSQDAIRQHIQPQNLIELVEGMKLFWRT